MATASNKHLKRLEERLKTKEQALELLQPYEKCEEVLLSGKTTFNSHPSQDEHFIMEHGGEEFVFSNYGFEKMNRLMGVPHTYAKKIPSQYLFPHMSFWLNEGDVSIKAFLKGKKDKDGRRHVSGFAHADAYYYPVSRILENVDEITTDYMVEGLDDISWRHSDFGLVFPNSRFDIDEPGVGDVLYGGVKVQHSLLGEVPFKISSFLLTLACLNGMTSVDEVHTFNRKQGIDSQDGWMTDKLQEAITALNTEVDKVKNLAKVPITNEQIPPYISHAFDQQGINKKTREAILHRIIEQNPKNLYELMNAITAVSHVIENRREVGAIQMLGGFVASHAASCKKCHRPY